jgi:hypothetical protein
MAAAAFKDGTWAQRQGTLGDPAEKKLLEVHPTNLVRWGLDRPPLQVGKLPKRIRYAPDFLASDVFIECQGVGRDQVIKLKWEKLSCLYFWDQVHPVQLFFWDSHRKRHTYVPLRVIGDLVNEVAELGHFHEGVAFFALPASVVFERGH